MKSPRTTRVHRTSRRSALKQGLLATSAVAIGVPVVSGTAAAARVTVAADGSGDFETIQAGVDAASSGDTVVVKEGTYREQVVVDEDLDLVGDGSPTIEAPDEMERFVIAESGPTWEPIVFAYGGDESGGTVSGPGTVDVDVSGFEIDGRSLQPAAGRKVGILFRNVGGSSRSAISDNRVHSLGVGGKETMGILAYGDSHVVVRGNAVSEFERGGIGANGDGGAHPSPTVRVRNNTVDSNSSTAGWAPNGVQIGYGADGDVKGNTIVNCRWAANTDEDWTASGVLVFESDGVQVSGNSLANNDVGVAASSWGYFRASADNNTVVGNDISDALVGVNLRVVDFPGYTARDPSVSNNKVVNNDVDDPDGGPEGAVGVLLNVVDDGDFSPSLRNNKVVRNSISGFADGVIDGGSETKARAQAFDP